MSGASISYPHLRPAAAAAAGEAAGSSAAAPPRSGGRGRQSRTEARSASNNGNNKNERSSEKRDPEGAAAGEMATCYPSYEPVARATAVQQQQKDYSRPLHVDCSVEYELPNQAKPPAGVRNEPLLMIHPCYFRKIESQRRSPFVNNLPTRQSSSSATAAAAAAAAVAVAVKRRLTARAAQQAAQQVPPQTAQYPVQYAATDRNHNHHHHHQQQQQQPPPPPPPLWEPMPPLAPITAVQQPPYCKQLSYGGGSGGSDSSWTEPDRSPDRPDDGNRHILSGKYRQYLRAHRLHPYVTSAIPIASTFPQIHHQVCYNV